MAAHRPAGNHATARMTDVQQYRIAVKNLTTGRLSETVGGIGLSLAGSIDSDRDRAPRPRRAAWGELGAPAAFGDPGHGFLRGGARAGLGASGGWRGGG